MADRKHILIVELARLNRVLLESRVDFLKQKYTPLILKALEAGKMDLRGISGGMVVIPPAPGEEMEDFHHDVMDDLMRKKKWNELAVHIFDVIVHSDPNPQKKNTQWLLNMCLLPMLPLKLEDLDKAKHYLTLFEKNKPSLPVEYRNIMAFKTVNDLWEVVKDLKPMTKREMDRDYEKNMLGQTRLVMNTPEYRILIPLTKEASCHFGTNTQWCTAATSSHNYFDSYNSEGPLYNILEKKTNTRWQYHMASGQFMDEEDREIDVEDFAHRHKAAAIALANDVVDHHPDEFERLNDQEVVIHKWKDMDDCVDDIATKDGKRYYEYYIKDDNDFIAQADFGASYDSSTARNFLFDLEKQDKELLTKFGQWLYLEHKDNVDIDDIVEDYDPSNVRHIMMLVDDVEDDAFKEAVESAMRTGSEVGAQNEAFKIFRNEIEKNGYLQWKTTKSVEVPPEGTHVDPKDIDKNLTLRPSAPDEKHEWTGKFMWDTEVGFVLTISQVAERLDKIGESIGEIAEELEAQIDPSEPYYGMSDFDDESATERFIEEIHQILP
jgi:hypothetical protein